MDHFQGFETIKKTQDVQERNKGVTPSAKIAGPAQMESNLNDIKLRQSAANAHIQRSAETVKELPVYQTVQNNPESSAESGDQKKRTSILRKSMVLKKSSSKSIVVKRQIQQVQI